ncbi:MAG: sugar phosphate nucleotidyltransferase [Thermodesulfobacteriota bacterium]|nr:sugar phosphate nucleotidyltransferase [Thermodesulfobacteriota bacterium]
MIGVIPAAGKGTRAYPYTKNMPKGMLKINGKPLLHNTISIMRDKLKISDIYIIVSQMSESIIRDYFGDGSDMNVRLTYVKNNNLEKGLAYSVLLAKDFVKDYCCVMLSDEYYLNSNHDELAASDFHNSYITCLVKENSRIKEIRRNYNVVVDGDKVTALIEKPEHAATDILGCGTWILHRDFMYDLKKEFEDNVDCDGNLVAIMDKLCKRKLIKSFKLKGEYININSRDEINKANNITRTHLFNSSKISLIMIVENENNLAHLISDYYSENIIDEIVLVSRNPLGAAKEFTEKFGKVVVLPSPPSITQYGEKIKYGMENATGDIFIITPSDDSFSPKDLRKLLTYICEADMVVGTRTTREMIEQGTNMNTFVRIVSYLLARTIELLWYDRKVRITDVGCIYRALWKNTFYEIRDSIESKGPELITEMLIELLERRMRIIEIPVSYCNTTDEHHINLPNRTLGMFFRLVVLIGKKIYFKRKR